jgi:hypothetical protein
MLLTNIYEKAKKNYKIQGKSTRVILNNQTQYINNNLQQKFKIVALKQPQNIVTYSVLLPNAETRNTYM